jgi:hypothetical protein
MRRREFLARLGLLLGGYAMGALAGGLSRATLERTSDRRFSGSVSIPEGFRVPPNRVWEFDPNRTTTVEVASNVIVDGTLRMRPSSPRIVHTLRFVGIDEAEFIGGGMEPIPSDVGVVGARIGEARSRRLIEASMAACRGAPLLRLILPHGG